MGFLNYWRLIGGRAWTRTWTAVVERDVRAILRDAVIAALAAYCVFYLKPVLASLNAPVNVTDSLWDYGLWIVAGLLSLFAIFVIYFLIEAVAVTPYVVFKELQSNASSASVATDELLALRRREVAAQEVHNAVLTAQIQQRDEEVKRRWSDDLSKAISAPFQTPLPPSTPVPNMGIREAFLHICPTIISEDDAAKMERIGSQILDLLSTGQIHAWGRRISSDNKKDVSSLQPIDASYWSTAKWVFMFFNDKREKHDPHCWTPSAPPPVHNDFADVHLNTDEVLGHW